MKDVKTKPQGTSAPKNKPKTAGRAVAPARDVKAVMKDQFIRQKAAMQSAAEQPEQKLQRAEVEATESVENAAYNTADTVYRKGKRFAENKIKQHIQKVKTRENQSSAPQNANAPNAPQEKPVSQSPSNTPKTADNAPKIRETPQQDIPQNAPKQRNMQEGQTRQRTTVKTKEEYIRTQRMGNAPPDAVKTKENYIRQHNGQSELPGGVKQKQSASAPKMREPTTSPGNMQNAIESSSDSIIPKTREAGASANPPKTKAEAIKDARKEYVSDKFKTKAKAEKQLQSNVKTDTSVLPKNTPLQKNEIQSSVSVPKTQNPVSVHTDAPPQSKSLPKTKESYIMRQRQQNTANLIKTPDRQITAPKQNTHTVSRNVSSGNKRAVKIRSISKGGSAVKKGNAYVVKATRKRTAKTAKKAVKTQKQVNRVEANS